jgi:mono/diheme cytochrome c family protein
MGSARQLLFWVVIAAAASALLGSVLWWERGHASARWSPLPIGSPGEGAELFQRKGCVHCHAVKGLGGTSGPDLGSAGSSRSHPEQLVVAMWNHAPRMWKRMEAEHLDYPRLDDQEMADVFAYLFVARQVDEAGDAARGRQLFETKGCTRCHAPRPSRADEAGGDRAFTKSYLPVEWARAMWNHPLVTDAGKEAPTFEGREMNDLLAYARGTSIPGPDRLLLAADPDRGWKLFRERSCTACHSVKDETGRVGPQLGPGRELPATIVQLAGTMWNHSEAMSRAMRERGLTRPRFDSPEMADLVAFLYSVRSTEPGGSPRLGEVLYAGRGCDRCHGVRAEGTERGPGLRGRGIRFTSISFAAALWRHGPHIYRRARENGQIWPELSEGDVGDLITFLNSSATVRP